MPSTTVSTLVLTSQIVNMYLTTTMLAIGVVGGLLNIIVFLSLKTFRDSPCAFYLTVMSFTNIGQLFTTFLTRIVLYQTGISWTTISEPFCKFRWFFIDVCALVSFTCLCLATIDQFLATSSKIKWQQYSNIKLSRYLCLIFFILWILITSPIIMFYQHVRSSTTGQMTCALTNPEYQIYITYIYLLVISGVLPIFITMLFGLLAYRNIQQIPYRTVPLVRRELDKQLTTMVLIQVILNFTNITPSTVISVYTSIATASKDALINAIVQLISQISIFLYYLYFASPFYIYICASKRFRHQLIYVIFQKKYMPRQNQVLPLALEGVLGSSLNRPKLSPYASWNPNGITFTNMTIMSSSPYAIFINTNNTIYVPDRTRKRILVWSNNNTRPTRNISIDSSGVVTLFVTQNDDVYINAPSPSYGVQKWQTGSVQIMYSCDDCYGIFIDIDNNLYCSIKDMHQVVKKSLNIASNALTIVAGTGTPGSTAATLNSPYGIFVDDNFNLYVADNRNNRIQLFSANQLNGTTVTKTIALYHPTAVVLDADDYLFIVDNGNSRIVGSGPNGFRCVIGCSGNGNASNVLLSPWSMAYDSFGNIYVTDRQNNRIQKFVLLNNTYPASYNTPKFCTTASWNPNATTFVDNSIIGTSPWGIFIDKNNTVYTASRQYGRIDIWFADGRNTTRYISRNSSLPYSIFVSFRGDIYISSISSSSYYIDKFTLNDTNSILVGTTSHLCYGLFVDINDILYCSMYDNHEVVKKPLDSNSNLWTNVAGISNSFGSSSTMLNQPTGIFVDINLDLYVADWNNDRIQLFRLGISIGITVVGSTSLNTTILLDGPSGVVLDADKNLFIVDQQNHRVVGSGPNGFQCLVGCFGNGSTSNSMLYPRSMAFDSYGNIYVVDRDNNRIQKFILMQGTCLSVSTTTTTTPEYTGTQCYSPIVTLIPGTSSSLSSPISFRRSQDFSIISLIDFNCNESVSIKTQWIIRNCTTICLNSIQLPSNVLTIFSELYIPSRTLPYGVFQLELLVTITGVYQSTIRSSIYVRINPSGITANLVQLGTSMITVGYEKDLLLDPGTFSIDPDFNSFNSSLWKYQYYCRIYSVSMFPNRNGILLTIDDPLNNESNSSCLSNWTRIQYENTFHSAVTIFGKTLRSNRTYQFMVQMENRRNASLQATGYVLVKVEDTRPQLIAIGCVISIMCSPNLEYQLVNPTTQVALFALCIGNCTAIQHITWKIYIGSMNQSSNDTEWILFNQMTVYNNIWFFGVNTSNFTATKQLFLSYPHVNLWRFQVTYSFPSETSSSALNFIINRPPVNGSCLISPLNGSTSTVFRISCSDWFDEDDIKDYSLYFWTSDPSKRTIIAYSSISQFQVRLPAGDEQTSELNLMISIRDQLDSVTEYNLSSVYVQVDIESVQHPMIQLLLTENQNTVGQVLISLLQQFNKINEKNILKAVANGIPYTSISISPLDNQRLSQQQVEFNESALIEFKQELNSHATIREYLLSFLTQLPITTSNSIKLQSATLAELTKATNQLTRMCLNNALDRCYQLTLAFNSMATRIAYEDAQIIATQLIQCATNLLTAVNGPLQQRTIVLDLDQARVSTIPDDYETDLESEWSKINKLNDKNSYYQKQTANQIQIRVNQIISLLTSTLNIHINLGQNLVMNTSEVFMSLESLTNKQFKLMDQAEIRLPSNLHMNSSVSVRSILGPLASFGNSNTNLSRSISFSFLDHNGNELHFETNQSQPIEIFIPRDPNFILPDMILQNVTAKSSTAHQQLFNLHYVNLTNQNSISIHLEMQSLNRNLSYLLVYKFDQIPQLNDDWTLFCHENLSNESIFTYFIDNQKTTNHTSLVFGLRELTLNESMLFCSNSTILPKINQPYNFTSNYKLRMYASGCYYLDVDSQWQSDGLLVGSQTNHNRTQCVSTHLTAIDKAPL